MSSVRTKFFRAGRLLLRLLLSLLYPASAAFRAGRGMFIALSLLQSFSILTVFWLFAGPGVILYFICMLLAFILTVRNREAVRIQYGLRIPVLLLPLVISIVGVTGIALSIKDFQSKEFLARQKFEGAKLARSRCGICHSLKGHGINVGPPLADIHMRKIASIKGFNYSEAFRKADKIWTEKELDDFLANVQTYIKGSNMVIQSVEDESERKALIAYLIGSSKKKRQLQKVIRKKR